MSVRAGRQLREAIRVERELAADDDGTGLGLCPYLRGVGEKTCQSGCWEEPRCQTDMPVLGWPKPWVIGDKRRRTHRRRHTNGGWRW